MIVAEGAAVMVTLEVATACPQPPVAGIVLVTVYVPGVEARRLIIPVAVLVNTKPGADANVPAMPPPLKTGDGFGPFWQ